MKNSVRNNGIIRNNIKVFREVFSIDPFYVIISMIIRIVSGLRTALLTVYLLGYVLFCVENSLPLMHIVYFICFCTVFIALAFLMESYYNNVFNPIHCERITREFQERLFSKQLHANLENYDLESLYTNISFSNFEVVNRPLAVTNNVFAILETTFTTLVVFIGSILNDWVVISICTISFIVGIVLTNITAKKTVDFDTAIKYKDKELGVCSRLLYMPEYAKENRLSNIHNHILKKYKVCIEEKKQLVQSIGKDISNISVCKNIFCQALSMDFLIPLYLSIKIIFFKNLSVSDFVIFMNACYQVQLKLDSITGCISTFIQNGHFIERLNNTEKIKDSIECNEQSSENISLDLVDSIELQNVSYSYENSKFRLSNINIKINSGEKIAIVGRNGSGKTTLVKLLLRLYDPTEGSILINDNNIKEINISHYRNKFSVIFQDFNIYATTVKNNVSMGACNGDIDSALKKAEMVHIKKDLEKSMTNEFDSEGILFSGGLLQRLALSRVFYQNGDIIILDEPTASLDVAFERKFYDIVFKELKDKTVILISHRLSSVSTCDRIFYMEDGHVEEEGTHKELISKKGRYYELFNSQFE